MTIIIEGPDNSGKTTLGLQLQHEWGLSLDRSHRITPPFPEMLLAHSAYQLRPRLGIQDRCYAISEYVYGRVLRGGPELGSRHNEVLLDLYLRPLLIIYCRPPTDRILRNSGRDQMGGVLENHMELIEEYDWVMREVKQFSQGRVIEYDYTQPEDLSGVINRHLGGFHSQVVSSIYCSSYRRK